MHDSNIILANYASVPKIFIGDVMQPSPYVADRIFNPFAVVRTLSTFEREVMRGRHHFKLTESGRTGPSAIGLASDLIYGGRLRSAIPDHEDTPVLIALLNKTLGTNLKSFPHLFLNVSTGGSEKVGPRKSTSNRNLVKNTIKLIDTLVTGGMAPERIGIIDPYDADLKEFDRALSYKVPDAGKRPTVGSPLATMGGEMRIAIMQLPKNRSGRHHEQEGLVVCCYDSQQHSYYCFS